MKINFKLAWLKEGKALRQGFGPGAQHLFEDYLGRIQKFSPASVSSAKQNPKEKSGTKIWLCNRAAPKPVDSEGIALKLKGLLDCGTRNLEIYIGGPDGISKEEKESLQPDFIWSFGPLTLPHELAAVVAAEQIYRAFTILKGTPYHLRH